MPDVPDSPRVDELFSRAVVAQLAEQRAQRETFAALERKLDALERLVLDRLADLSKIVRGGETDLRLELMEEELSTRFTRLETLVKAEVESHLGGLAERLSERLSRLEGALRADDVAARLGALEHSVSVRLADLEDGLRRDEVPARLAALEQQVTERIAHLEETFRFDQVGPRLSALEAAVSEPLSRLEAATPAVLERVEALEASLSGRIGHLEESVRAEELGHRLKALELAIEERAGRDLHADTAELEQRLEALQRAVDERLVDVQSALQAAERDQRIQALDEAVSYRLTRLEGSLRQLEEHTATRLEELKQVSAAAEAGILERIAAESQVVGAHFRAVRPVVEAAAQAGSDLETALDELRRLAATARAAAAMAADPGATPPGEAPPGDGTPYSVASLDLPAGEDAEEVVFLPPEETPIPDRRFGGLLPRRER